MSSILIPLETIGVASPCSASWDKMAGTDRARFCSQCSEFVYNLSELTKDEVEALVLEKEGKLCVRFYRRGDGTMMTKDCPVGWQNVKRHFIMTSSLAVALATFVLSLITLAMFSSPSSNNADGHPNVSTIRRLYNYYFAPKQCVMGKM